MTVARVDLTFALAGFSKCGTTTLSAILGAHPDVLMPAVKEPWFFSWDEYADHWDWYEQQYPEHHTYRAVGDDSTTYTAHQFTRQTAQRLRRHFPELRVLVVARDPVDRIESAFRESHHSSHRYGVHTPFSLAAAMRENPGILQDSRYLTCLTPYLDLFPREQIKVVFLEDLRADPGRTIRESLSFIGVEPGDRVPDTLHLNAGATKYRDTRLLRALRRAPGTRQFLAGSDFHRQERWLRPLQLRKRNNRPVVWDDSSRELLCARVLPDAREFLGLFGGSPARWPRLEGVCASQPAPGTPC